MSFSLNPNSVAFIATHKCASIFKKKSIQLVVCLHLAEPWKLQRANPWDVRAGLNFRKVIGSIISVFLHVEMHDSEMHFAVSSSPRLGWARTSFPCCAKFKKSLQGLLKVRAEKFLLPGCPGQAATTELQPGALGWSQCQEPSGISNPPQQLGVWCKRSVLLHLKSQK